MEEVSDAFMERVTEHMCGISKPNFHAFVKRDIQEYITEKKLKCRNVVLTILDNMAFAKYPTREEKINFVDKYEEEIEQIVEIRTGDAIACHPEYAFMKQAHMIPRLIKLYSKPLLNYMYFFVPTAELSETVLRYVEQSLNLINPNLEMGRDYYNLDGGNHGSES